jgi:hypothetical protein
MARGLPEPANRRERDPTIPEAEPAKGIRPDHDSHAEYSLAVGIAQVSFDGEVLSEAVQAN